MPTRLNVRILMVFSIYKITHVQVASIAVQLKGPTLAKVYVVANDASNFDVVLPMEVVPVSTFLSIICSEHVLG